MGDLHYDLLLACNLGEALLNLSAYGPIAALFVDVRL